MHLYQRLLVVAEEGTLHANMGMNSSGIGTPLNNQLQHWKEQMESAGEKAALLSQKINKNKKDEYHYSNPEETKG